MLKLPETELEVMQAIWECEMPIDSHKIDAIIQKTHPMAQTTLLTLLSRLAKKGYIDIQKNGRLSTYIPLISKESYLASHQRNFFSKLCKGDMNVFASALCDAGLTKEEIEELKELLERGFDS